MEEPINLKRPPHSEEAEAGVLGSALLKPSILDKLDLRPAEFHNQHNALLWEKMLEMHHSNGGWDALTLGEFLSKDGSLERVGGYDRLVELQDTTLVPAHSEHYAGIVTKDAELRRQLGIMNRASERLYKGEDVADEVISGLMEVEAVEEHSVASILTQWNDARNGVLQTIPTPFADLDRQTGGLRLGLPVVFTGRSKAGKSMFLAWWYNLLGAAGIPALVFPFEDDYHITITRMAANLGKYKWSKIENGGEWVFATGEKEWIKTTQAEVDFAHKCLKEVEAYPIYFLDGSIPPNKLMGKVARFKKKHGIKVFFIDGAKDFEKPSGKYNDTGFDEECSQLIKKVCKKQKVAGVVVHHLTKIPDNELIAVGNVRGSGNIIGDCRSVYALQSKGLSEAGVAVQTDDWGRITTRRFDCLENNHGGTGSVLLESDLSKCQFYR